MMPLNSIANVYRLAAHIQSLGVDYGSARSAQELTEVLREEYDETSGSLVADNELISYSLIVDCRNKSFIRGTEKYKVHQSQVIC